MESLIKITTDPKHRIVIPSNVWKFLDLKYGDYIEVGIIKVKKLPSVVVKESCFKNFDTESEKCKRCTSAVECYEASELTKVEQL